jgi:hypothetical protein
MTPFSIMATNLRKRSCFPLFVGLLLLLASVCTGAAPWTEPGDQRLRHHVQVLADAVLIRVPVNTWPLMWDEIMDELGLIRGKVLTPKQQRAVSYISDAFERQTKTVNYRVATRAGEQIDPIRGFGDVRRNEQEATASVEYIGGVWAGRLQFSWADDPLDGRQYQHDGSYLSTLLGNWALTIGSLDRWWGPGWDSALILSNNARPIPGISLQRNSAEPFKTAFLRWLGPWQLVMFAGQLEDDRVVPSAKLFGMRVNFRPLQWLELGLSRTAQWGGDGRPQNFDSFVDVAIGNDNTGDGGITSGNEPGNQLAGIDWRASWAGADTTLAFYGEIIGEDEAGLLPSRRIVTLGLDGTFFALGSEFRIYLESTDTASERRYATARYDYTYEHAAYRSGYRYRGRAIGASIDNDSRAHHLALQWYPDARQSVVIKFSELDFRPNVWGTDSISNNGSSGLASLVKYHYQGRYLDVGIGYRYYSSDLQLDNVDSGDDVIDLSVGVSW